MSVATSKDRASKQHINRGECQLCCCWPGVIRCWITFSNMSEYCCNKFIVPASVPVVLSDDLKFCWTKSSGLAEVPLEPKFKWDGDMTWDNESDDFDEYMGKGGTAGRRFCWACHTPWARMFINSDLSGCGRSLSRVTYKERIFPMVLLFVRKYKLKNQ